MDRIAQQTNGAGFLKIWRLAESEKLKSQTLDKLALAPWRAAATNRLLPGTNLAALVRQNHSAALVRPLLDDLVKSEFYLEIREPKAGSPQIALAVLLDPKRAAEWDSNLQAVFGTLAAARKTPAAPPSTGWQIQSSATQLPPYLRHIEFTHAGAWTILGLSPDQNVVLSDVLARVQRAQVPFATAAGSDWIEAQVDLPRLSSAFSWDWDLPSQWPEISLDAVGSGDQLSTRARLTFPTPLQIKLDAWDIPTNLIHEPIQGFTAVRGIKDWLASLDWWKSAHPSETPNQVFAWSQSGSPFLVYAAAPLAHADKVMPSLGAQLMQSMNPMLASNRMGHWERSANSDGVIWRAPIITPFVQSIRVANNSFLFGGLSPYLLTNGLSPSVTIAEVLKGTNTVYFDREITGPRVEAWMYIGQLSRVILRRDQLSDNIASVNWFRGMGAFLAPTYTLAVRTGPHTISLTRSSTVGLTALELHALGDWLESPEFPWHPYSWVARLPALPVPKPPNGSKPSR